MEFKERRDPYKRDSQVFIGIAGGIFRRVSAEYFHVVRRVPGPKVGKGPTGTPWDPLGKIRIPRDTYEIPCEMD